VAGIIPDHVLDQVRHANDVVDVIGSYFPLKRAGANFRALCPFHKEKTPSFNVNQTKQIWHCFGCGAGGDVFGFVMKYENLDFVAAVRRLAERAGVRLELEESDGGQSRDEKDLLFKLHEQVAEHYHRTLMKDPAAQVARDYLKKRQITAEIAKKWRLGYSSDSWDGLITWGQERKFTTGLLETAGLVLRRDSGEGCYDRFRGRLMFPIGDEQGRTVGFSGRILTDAKDQPKYVNSPESPIFQKGRILFALDKAKRFILDEKIAVICEGQVDTISCHEAGMANVVAPQGTALTEQHARLLKRYAEEVVLMFDSDSAGQNAAVRGAEPLWDAGLVIRVAVLPAKHDPDSFVREFGAEKLKELVAGAQPFFVYLLERFSREHNPQTERGKLEIARQVAQWLVRTPTPILAATYAQQTAKKLGISEDVLRKEVSRLTGKNRSRVEPADEEGPEIEEEFGRPQNLREEKLLLQTILIDELALDKISEGLDTGWLTGSLAGDLIQTAVRLYRKGTWTGKDSFLNRDDREEVQTLVSELLLTHINVESPDRPIDDCLKTLEINALETRMLGLRNRMAQGGLKAQESMDLQRQVLDLRRKLDDIRALSVQRSKPSTH